MDRKETKAPVGYVLARQNWANGELMSAEYETEDGTKVIDSDLLENHDGWYCIEEKKVAEAKSLQKKKADTKIAEEKEEQERRDRLFAEAKQSGKKQILRKWITSECMENLEDCSFDQAIEWALPDGSTAITYYHCH